MCVCVLRSLKRRNPDLSEDVVLIRALRDSNLPKFLTDDALLFGYADHTFYFWCIQNNKDMMYIYN